MKTKTSLFEEIREATGFVAANADEVKIDEAKLNEISKTLNGTVNHSWHKRFDERLGKLSLEDELRTELAVGFTNARCWREPKWEIEGLGGSLLGMSLYLTAMEKGILWSSKLTYEDYWKVVDIGTGVELPRWKDRCDILTRGVKVFEEKYDNSILKFLEICDFDAGKIAVALLADFPNFRDVYTYKERSIPIYKLLQLAIFAFNSVLLRRNSKKMISGVEQLTSFADYKVPQIMRHFGVLRYSEPLAEKVDNKIELLSGSAQEIEIRACMIHAIELISEKTGLLPTTIDHCLWLKAQTVADMKPYHRTDTLYY